MTRVNDILKNCIAAISKRGWHGVCLGTILSSLFTLHSCIEPPLKLPAEEVLVDLPIVITDMEIVWDVDTEWKTEWYYGWDEKDIEYWDPIEYPTPSTYEVRRYFLGEQTRVPHSQPDAFTIRETSFRRSYEFGYYDMLLWSNIDTKEHTQTVVIDESDYDDVWATTSVTRSIKLSRGEGDSNYALYNQPEIFYSAYPRDVYISRNFEDYDYYNETEGVWVKHINCTLDPLVYIYLVQIILDNNDGRVVDTSGNIALSGLSNGVNVNSGHTTNSPGIIYFENRMKSGISVKGEKKDVIGGKLTTYGLCDMDGYSKAPDHVYHGGRPDITNRLYFELRMSNGSIVTLDADVTNQCQAHCHGGVITVHVDCSQLPVEPSGEGSIFNPTVEDYEELNFDIPI